VFRLRLCPRHRKSVIRSGYFKVVAPVESRAPESGEMIDETIGETIGDSGARRSSREISRFSPRFPTFTLSSDFDLSRRNSRNPPKFAKSVFLSPSPAANSPSPEASLRYASDEIESIIRAESSSGRVNTLAKGERPVRSGGRVGGTRTRGRKRKLGHHLSRRCP